MIRHSVRPRLRRSAGLSLLEMLIVIAIIGIMAGIGLVNFQSFRRNLELREAQLQVATSIERARGLSRRYSFAFQFAAEKNASNKFQYSTTAQSFNRNYASKTETYTNVSDPAPSTVELPANITISNVSSTTPVSFRMFGPFGRMNSAARVTLCVRHASNPNLLARIDVLGVTGKVVARGIESNPTCP
jgi:type IV pilus assembly protein PilA